MENKNMFRTADAMQKTVETLSETIIQVIDKLAGKKSDLKLTFNDLRLDAQFFNTRLNGSVLLDITMAKEIESTAM
jgi:hypothetical protein